MLSKEMEKALNAQINEELYSSYLYFSMATYFHHRNLGGFAHWMEVQAKEEFSHAAKIHKHVFDRGGRVILEAINKPQSEWKSTLEVFEDTLNHERHITGMIHALVDLAKKENDHATSSFLQWFINEQVEEEATATAILEKIKMIDDKVMGLFLMDRELGAR